MSGFKCPFCNEIMSINNQTKREYSLHFCGIRQYTTDSPYFNLTIYKCPNDECKRHTIYIVGEDNTDLSGLGTFIWPPYTCNHYPEFVPKHIRQDYQEACAVKDISTKASATLSRRCLQGMIRDFFGIEDKKTLHKEILALKGKVDDDVLDALLALKSIGNIGAHPEIDVNLMVDVEPKEASELISFIEYLIEDWYVAREKRRGLLGRLSDIDAQKSLDKQPQLSAPASS